MDEIKVEKVVEVELNNGELCFDDGFSRPATEEEKNCFLGRHPKAIKLSNGTYDIIRFFDYHRHSEYSLLDGCIRISDMVKRTKYIGAITDHGNMYGAFKWYQGMKKAGKIPVIGEEFYCETIDGKKSGHHLILLAKNSVGYKNLCKLSSLAFQNIYKKPHISYAMLKKYSEGLVCTSACLGGELSQLILNGNFSQQKLDQKLDDCVSFFQSVFGDDYYIEIQNHHIDDELIVNPKLIDLAHKHHIKVVAATDSHYENVSDHEVHEVLLCINTQKLMSDENRMKFDGDGYYLYSEDEVEKRFKNFPEAIDNTLDIMKKCQFVEIKTGMHYLPDFPIPPEFENDMEYLRHIASEGFAERFEEKFKVLKTDTKETKIKKLEQNHKYWERWKYEMSVIEKMGFSGYFLVVWDFLKFCRDNKIPVGAGRGSGAGSLVLYCLHITDFDPIKYDLLFERFLNPDRISLPDIDSDISQRKREKVIKYVTEKYGEDHVSHIITFGCLAAKSAIKDVARVYGVPAADANRITKTIPNDPKTTIETALKSSPDFLNMIRNNDLYEKIVKVAQKIEGLPRQTGVHACGICVGQKEINEYCPTAMVKDDNDEYFTTTQWEGPEAEEIGLVKFDFLGLRTLDVLDISLNLIKKHDKKFNMEPDTIPIDDIPSYLNLKEGKTDGVFQFESDGMTSLVKQMFNDVKSSDSREKGEEYFERLTAAVALYRPGPMDEIPNYLNAMKSGNIVYDHPKLKSILSSTYGILVYQEEIMMAVRELAGFSKGDADKIRKAMGKKKMDIMNEYSKYFIYGSAEYDKLHPEASKNIPGCINSGLSESTAKMIWNKMVKFASYAFNKSHATCYAALGARTAYLNCHYPVEYMAGILNSYLGNNKKVVSYVGKCNSRGITLLAPNVNVSDVEFSVAYDSFGKGQIVFGLSGINGIGTIAAKAIIDEREQNGDFSTIEDFLVRMAPLKINKKAIEALVYTGAFDSFHKGNRAELAEAIPKMLDVISAVKKENSQQLTMFEDLFGTKSAKYEISISPTRDFSTLKKSLLEKEYLGYFVKHPMTDYSDKLNSWRKKEFLDDISQLVVEIERSGVTKKVYRKRIAGLVQDRQIKSYTDSRTGRPKSLLIFNLNDETGTIKCVAFDNVAAKYAHLVTENSIIYVLCTGKLDDFGPSCEVSDIYVFSESDRNRT